MENAELFLNFFKEVRNLHKDILDSEFFIIFFSPFFSSIPPISPSPSHLYA